jgi:flagellar basal-body rod protein FlgC
MAEITPPVSPVMAVAASALRAQQARMRVIAENIANADSTSTTGGGPAYRRQMAVFQPTEMKGDPASGLRAKGVRVASVSTDAAPFRRDYNPSHPAADAQGYVNMPNVDPLIEALDMRAAQRAYEANLSVIETARSMTTRTLDLLKK